MTQHPPLYYAYVAVVLDTVGYLDLRSDHALLVARLAGLIFVLPLPLLAWDSVRRITRSPRAAIIAAASFLFIPQLAHIMGSVSNDSMTIAFSGVVIWLGVRIMTGDRSWWTTIGLGLALALALLSKGTAVPLVAYVAFVLLVWPRDLGVPRRLARCAAGMGAAFLGGWWWTVNLFVHGTLQPAGLVYPAQPWPEGTGPSVLYFSEQLWIRVTRSFWGSFGWGPTPLPRPLIDVLSVVCLVVVLAYAFRRSRERPQMAALGGLVLLFVIAQLYMTWPSYVRSQLPAGMQGRYFFPVLIALIVLSAVAWRKLIPIAEHTVACIGLLTNFALVAIIGILIEFAAAYDGRTDWFARAPLGGLAMLSLLVICAACCIAAFVCALRIVQTDTLEHRRPRHQPARNSQDSAVK